MGENIRLCYGCMEPLGDNGVCSLCGYSNDSPYLPSYLAPGTGLNNRYLVGKLLHCNGESGLYIAYDAVLCKKVIIREYMPDTLCKRVKGSSLISVNQNNLAQYKTFMSEFTELNKVLSKMRTLNHINPAIDMFAENNTTYAVFDHLKGMTLAQYLQENAGELTWEHIKKMFPPIFTTISLIHNEGLIHRGISPETIWVTDSGELKLTDFCIPSSRTANTELAPEMFSGYAAPEQYSSSNWQGTWTDVYAISAVLYRMLTGTMPVDAVSRIGNDNLCEPALINPNVPQNVSKVIMAGMKLSGDIRIQTVTELVTKLFEQPDYLEHGGAGRNVSSTVVKREVMSQEEREAKIKKANANRIKIPIFVFIAVLAILLVAALAALSVLNDDGDEKVTTGSDTSVSSITLPVTAPVTSASISSQASDAVSGSEEIYVMPDFLGKNYDLMKTSETYKEWFIFEAEYDYKDDYAKGLIYDQSVKPGSIITKGTKVTFKVSSGPKNVAVPDYFGKKANDYVSELGNLGIKYDVQYITDEGFLNDYVTRLSKEPGETIDIEKGEVLIVYVCKNPHESSEGENYSEFTDITTSPNEDDF